MKTLIYNAILFLLIVVTPILPQSEMTTNEFTFSNLYFVDNFTYLQVRGEVKNESQKNYGNVYFSLKLYDDKSELIGVILIFINNINKGQKKTFESSTDHIDLKLIKKYKIVFDSSD
jgi:hypothetical protein